MESEVLLGTPAREVLHHADERNVSLIVVASWGRSGRGPWLLGNIAGKLLRATNKPVLQIRAPADSAALQQRSLVKKILIPLDGSRLGEVAIPYVESLAQVLGSQVALFQAYTPLALTVAGEGAALPENEHTKEDGRARASALAYLDSVGKTFQERKLRTSSAVSLGSAADEIIEYAEANSIHLIARSTHGRWRIGRWVFGGVTDKVLRAGDMPVLTVRATKT